MVFHRDRLLFRVRTFVYNDEFKFGIFFFSDSATAVVWMFKQANKDILFRFVIIYAQ